jgi:3-hydroxyacyl-[acyl-carrier-protein] dehydratase
MSTNPSQKKATMDIKDLFNILPHRYPFLLVDKIIELDLENERIVGQKNVTFNEEFFQGHFPGGPIMPGVLMLEALAQAGGVLAHLKVEGRKMAILLSMTDVKFRHPVRPGDVLLLKCQGLHFSSKGGRVKAEGVVNDKVVVEAEIGFVYVDRSQL